jgi:hypothetical protein
MHTFKFAAAVLIAATALGTSAYAASAQPVNTPGTSNLWRLPVPDYARNQPHPPAQVLAQVQPGADTQIFVLNVGNQPLNIERIALGGIYASQFQIDAQNCAGKPLPPQASCTLSVTGKPAGFMQPGDAIAADVLATYNDGGFADALVTVQAPADANPDNNTIAMGDSK